MKKFFKKITDFGISVKNKCLKKVEHLSGKKKEIK